jgi:hypothetical protein
VSPLQQLTRTFERFKVKRPAPPVGDEQSHGTGGEESDEASTSAQHVTSER